MTKTEELIRKIDFITQELTQLECDFEQAKEDLTEEPLDNEAEIQALFKEIQTYNIGVTTKKLANELHVATQRLISKRTRVNANNEHILISNTGIAIRNYYRHIYLKNLRSHVAIEHYEQIASNFGLKIINTIHKQDKKEIIKLIMDNRSILRKVALGFNPIEHKFRDNDQTIDTVVLSYSTVKYRKIVLSSLTLESTDDGDVFIRIMNDENWTLDRIHCREEMNWNEKYLLSKLLKNPNTKQAIMEMVKQYKKQNETIIKQAQELIGKLGVYTLIEAL